MMLGFLILASISCKAQQIAPIETKIDYIKQGIGIPENITYLKDVNHVLDKYVGVWKGTNDSKNYEFRIVKYTDLYDGLSEDKLQMRYIITDANGIELENTIPESNRFVIHGLYLMKGYYVLNYVGRNAKCGQKGEIYISTSIKNNYTQMLLSMEPEMEWEPTLSECPNGISPQIIPTDQMRLTKQ